MKFQVTAPMSAASTTNWETALVSTMPLPRVAATSVEISAPTTFATAAMPSAAAGRRAGHGRGGVRGIMEAVGEVEQERSGDEDEEQGAGQACLREVGRAEDGTKPSHPRRRTAPEAPSDQGSDRGACEGEQGARADQADGLQHAHASLTCNACATFQKKCTVRDSADLGPCGNCRDGNLCGGASAGRLSI